MQKRYFGYLNELTCDSLREFLVGILPSGIYAGCTLSVKESGEVILGKGKFILSDGLIVEETKDVVIDTLTEVKGTTWPIKTVVAYGNPKQTLQRDSINYSIINGVDSNSKWEEQGTTPYLILGWMSRNPDNSWKIIQPNFIDLTKAGSPSETSLIPPFNIDKNLPFINTLGVGMRQAFSLNEPTTTFKVMLGNLQPLNGVKCKLLKVPKNVHIKVNLFGSDMEEASSEFEMHTFDSDSTILVDFTVNRPNCRHSALEFVFSMQGEVSPDSLGILADVSFSVDPSKLI